MLLAAGSNVRSPGMCTAAASVDQLHPPRCSYRARNVPAASAMSLLQQQSMGGARGAPPAPAMLRRSRAPAGAAPFEATCVSPNSTIPLLWLGDPVCI